MPLTPPQAQLKKVVNKFRAFLSDYRHYRNGHVLVYRLGRWESFCRALEWARKGK